MALGGNLVLMETVKLFRMTSDEAPLRRGGGMKYASHALARRRLLWPALALGGLLLLVGCARDGAQKHYERGKAFVKQGEYAKAEKEYREAIRLKPDYAAPHYNLGIVVYFQGKYAEAEKEFREAIRLKQDYIEAHYYLWLLLGDMGRTEEAEAEYRELIKYGQTKGRGP